MKIKNFTFSAGPSGGLDIVVTQTEGDHSPVIASLGTTQEDLYALLAFLGLSADEDLSDEDDDLLSLEELEESEDSEDEEEA